MRNPDLTPEQHDELGTVHSELVELHKRVHAITKAQLASDHDVEHLLDAQLGISDVMQAVFSAMYADK